MSEGGSFKEKVFWESDGMGGESNLNLTFCGQLISNLMKQQYLDGEEWLNFGDRVYIDDQVKFTWGVRGPPLPPLPPLPTECLFLWLCWATLPWSRRDESLSYQKNSICGSTVELIDNPAEKPISCCQGGILLICVAASSLL